VRAVLDEHAAEMLRPASRAAMLALEVSRLETLEAVFLRQAAEQLDSTAGTLCVKISQRKAALCGLDQPATIRMDVTAVTEHEDGTTTTRMLEVIRRLRDEHEPSPGERPDEPK